jgi:hypothetical protein
MMMACLLGSALVVGCDGVVEDGREPDGPAARVAALEAAPSATASPTYGAGGPCGLEPNMWQWVYVIVDAESAVDCQQQCRELYYETGYWLFSRFRADTEQCCILFQPNSRHIDEPDASPEAPSATPAEAHAEPAMPR